MIRLEEGTILNNIYDDKIVRELNGIYTFTFKVLTENEDYKKINIGTIVEASDLIGNLQKFRVYSKTDYNKYIRVFCKHIFFDLDFNICNAIKVDRKNGKTVLDAFKQSLIESNNFNFYSDIVDPHSFNADYENSLDVLLKGKHSILGQWGGEIFIDNNVIKLNHKIGIDTEHLFTINKNIKSIESEENGEKLTTRLYLSRKIQGEGNSTNTIKTIVDSPLISNYPIIYSHKINVEDDSIKNLEDLTNYGIEKFKKSLIDIPLNTVKIKVTEDIRLNLGDTAIILFEKYGILKRLQVVKYVFSPFTNKLESVEFGSLSNENLSRTITEKNNKIINNIVDNTLNLELSKTVSNFKKILDYEISNINTELDTETVKALSNAEIKSHLKSEEGKQDLINSITADITRLNSVIVNTELLNTIVARMDIAEIKRLIVDTAFINSIISKEEFIQQFENRGVNVVNIFSKLKDSITQSINTVVDDKDRNLKTELISLLEQKSNEIKTSISSVNTRLDNLNNDIVYNLIEGTRDFLGTWVNSWSWKDGGEEQGFKVKYTLNRWMGLSKEISVEAGKTYTFSAYIKRSVAGEVYLYLLKNGTNVRLSATTTTFRNVENNYRRVHFTFRAVENGVILPRFERGDDKGVLAVYGYCLCEGKNTSWIPHIKEIQEKFDTTEIERNISNITQRQDSITQEVTEVKEGIKNFKVGTVNLLNGTNSFNGEFWKHKSNWNIENENFKNFIVLSRQESKGGIYQEYVVKTGEIYTFSGFVKRESTGDVKINLVLDTNNIELDVREKLFNNIGSEFQRISLTFKALENGIIQPRIEKIDTNGKLFVCGLKLENGTFSTDWTPSIDDSQDNESITRNYILNLQVDNDKLEKQINELIKENSKLKTIISTELKQTNDTFEFLFNNFKSIYDENNNLIFDKINDFSRYIRFVNGNIEMGETNNPLILKIKNNRIQFLQNGYEVAFFSNNRLFVTETEITHSLTLGKFGFFPRENGNLSLRKVGN